MLIDIIGICNVERLLLSGVTLMPAEDGRGREKGDLSRTKNGFLRSGAARFLIRVFLVNDPEVLL